MCMRHGLNKIVVGALLLLNFFVWPKWLGVDGWVSFAAILLVIGGFLMLVFPHPDESCCVPEAVKGKKKGKK